MSARSTDRPGYVPRHLAPVTAPAASGTASVLPSGAEAAHWDGSMGALQRVLHGLHRVEDAEPGGGRHARPAERSAS